MKFCRINLSQTNYKLYPYAEILHGDNLKTNIDNLLEIYTIYCRYKKFISVMPLFRSELLSSDKKVIAYYDHGNLIAFSLIQIYDSNHVESEQFAWNYHNPKLRLGIESLKHECAYFKLHNFQYLYLGEHAEYKSTLQGYEILGPI